MITKFVSKEQNQTTKFGGVVLLFFSVFMLGYFIPRNNFIEEIIFFGTAWIGLWLIHNKKNISNIFVFGLLLRLSLLISTPLLSQDYIRFLWDGYLTYEGINPLLFKPSELFDLIKESNFAAELAAELNRELSHQESYSRYFPLQQWIFFIAALTKSKLGGIIVLRIIIIAFDIATYFILKEIFKRYTINKSKLYLYWLNPLVILEFTGNLHTEGVFICFLLISLLSLSKMEDLKGGFFLSLSFCSNILSASFLPLLLLKGGRYRWFKLLIGFIPFSVITFSPFIKFDQLSKYLSHITQGIQTNTSKISLLTIFEWFEFKMFSNIELEFTYLLGYLFAGLIILIIAWKYRYRNRKVLFTAFTLITSIILILSPSIKPSLIIIPLALSLCTNFSFPLVWSGLAVLYYVYFDYSIPIGLKNSITLTSIAIVFVFFYKDLNLLFKR